LGRNGGFAASRCPQRQIVMGGILRGRGTVARAPTGGVPGRKRREQPDFSGKEKSSRRRSGEKTYLQLKEGGGSVPVLYFSEDHPTTGEGGKKKNSERQTERLELLEWGTSQEDLISILETGS